MKRHLVPALPAALLLTAALPAHALAHVLGEQYQAPLPLIAYVVGAAIAVAMSFAFVMLRNPPSAEPETASAPRRVPAWLRGGLRLAGILGWLWIVVQTAAGGSGDADVASLFLWVYGWVGLALLSALLGPAWSWLDPFSTLHASLSWIGRRLGLSGGAARTYPRALGKWPAVVGFSFFVWLELVARVEGGRSLGIVLIGYTLITLAGMLYYGRDAWRSQAEVFSVWFGLLGRLAPYELVGRLEDGLVRRRPFAGGLAGRWSRAELVLVALGTGSIIFDGLSQTQIYFDLIRRPAWFRLPAMTIDAIVAAAFLLLVVCLVLAVAARLGRPALGAGLLPVAVGYLVAHYLLYLLVDGQRIVNALNDPLQRGDNLLPFDLGFYEPVLFLPTAIVWTIQLAAVVGGHVLGAWAGHTALTAGGSAVAPLHQVPLAALMVLLTSLTLWSLGQAVIIDPEAGAVLPVIPALHVRP
ncbi:MAG TPA: hypothetical protein VMP67_01535 [Candidatus Limnocylindria bacterium]|nr:hypothetical protein [Candidatus Limnocylindria bacterium]